MGKLFKWMKILSTVQLVLLIIQMNKFLKWFVKLFQVYGLIMERAMLLRIVFISFVVVVNFMPLFSQSKKEIISISHQFKMRAELIVVVRFSHIDVDCNVSTAVEKRWVHFLILNRWIEGSGRSNRSNGWCSSLHWHF